MDTFLQQLINGLTLGCVYAVVALGYTMVYGIIQLINFAHGEVVMIGAMVAFSVITALAGSGLPPLVIVFAGVLMAIPACMAVGYTVERVAYRPLLLQSSHFLFGINSPYNYFASHLMCLLNVFCFANFSIGIITIRSKS